MKIISYSLTGNNGALAASLAKELAAEHIRITEPKARKTGAIAIDMMLNRTPKVSPDAGALDGHDLIVFVGPVWMGQAAAPFRAYLKHLKKNPCRYAYVSISGGALGPNKKLAADLKKRTGVEPAACVDMHITDLLPPGTKPDMKATGAYRVSGEDIRKLADNAVEALREIA